MLKHILLLLLLSGGAMPLLAQYVWDGGGDGTSWDDADNWMRNAVPAADSIVVFADSVTVTGTAPANPAQLKFNPGAKVVLDLDLTVGDGSILEHAVVMGDTSAVTFGTSGSSRTFTLAAGGNKHCMVAFGGSDMASITVGESATVLLTKGNAGINLANAASTVTNNGSIQAAAALKDGFRVVGTFINAGNITGAALQKDLFNVKNGGMLSNTATGRIVANKSGDDAIELISDAVFENYGSLALTTPDSSGSANSAIAVGNATTAASFVNYADDVVLVGGLDSTNGRALYVYPTGELTNRGTLTISGGNDGSRLFVEGTAVNDLNAILDLTDGRFNVATSGTFTNNGLLKTTRPGTGGFTKGTSVNNGFFDYAASNSFSAGDGSILNKGFSLNNNDIRVNARTQCAADLVNAPYEWFLDGTSYAMADDTGRIAFTARSLAADSVVLTTTLAGVSVKVVNICPEAVITTSVFGARPQVQALVVSPNPLGAGQGFRLQTDENVFREKTELGLYDQHGRLLQTFRLPAGSSTATELQPKAIAPGLYYLRGSLNGKAFVARLLKH